MFAIRPASRDRLSHWLTWPDAAVAAGSSILAPVIWSLGHAPMSNAAVARYMIVAVIVSVAATIVGRIGEIAVQFFSTVDAISLLKVAALSVVIIAALQFMLNRGEGIGRGLPALHFVIFAFGLFATRALERWALGRGRNRVARPQRPQTVIVIGASRLAVAFIASARQDRRRRVLAVLDDDGALQGRSIAGCPVIGRPASLETILAEYAVHGVTVDKLFFAIPAHELKPAHAQAVAAAAERFACHTLRQGEIFPESQHEPQGRSYAPHELAAVEDVRTRLVWDLKRVIDVAIALTLLVALSPMILSCTLVVLLDLGFPALFLQERMGRDGRAVNVLKFRTMRAGATTPTRCGAYLRRTRLDELPQLINILRGQMSLIGPRPLLASEQGDRLSLRLVALPGLTGWAQVCGANLCSFDEKIALDEWYVRNASLWLDARILLSTVRVVALGEVRREGAIALALAERAARQVPPSQDGDAAPDAVWALPPKPSLAPSFSQAS